MLVADSLVLHYGSHAAVRGVSFEVRRGEVVALIGPNGAGKSSTISMLVGIVPPTSGTVRLGGAPLTRDALDVRRRIGFVPDRPDVYEHLTAREYVRFVGGLYGMRRREIDRAAAPLFERFDLGGAIDHPLQSYSHGMRQKAVLVATLAHQPDLLVLDEPIVGLDPVSAQTLEDVIRERAAAGAAVLFSTHLLDVAHHVADRVVVIQQGVVRAQGTVAELLATHGAAAGAPTSRELNALFFHLIATPATPGVTEDAR